MLFLQLWTFVPSVPGGSATFIYVQPENSKSGCAGSGRDEKRENFR